MNGLQQKIRAVEDEHAEETLNNHLKAHDEDKFARALMVLGGVKTADRIAQSISSQVMNAMITFQTQDLHESLGFNRFADFLDKSEFSPMSKNEFYKRKELFESEGEKVFDLLTELGISLSKRKLLGKGNISLDGETVVILDNDTGEEISIELKDKSRILETITALADANADKSKRLTKGKDDNDRLKRKLTDLEEALDKERSTPRAADRDEIETSYLLLNSIFKRLNTLLENAPLIRVADFEERNLRVIAAQYQYTNEIIAQKLPSGADERRATLTDSDEDRLASLLDDEE